MDILIAIREFLLNHPLLIQAGVQGAFYNNVQTEALRPNLVMMVIGGSDGLTHQGPDGLMRYTIRIQSRGDNSKDASVLGRAVFRALNGASFNIQGISVQLCKHTAETSDYNEAAKVQRRIDSFMVAWRYSS